jgi:hypothetical protein
MSKNVILIVAIIVVIGGAMLFQTKGFKSSQTTTIPVPTIPKSEYIVVYKGTSPCADCPGIDVDLTLTSKDKYTDMGTFTLKQTYEDRDVKPLESSGNWTVDRGSAADPDATVYVLNYDKRDQIQNYLRVDDKTLRYLSTDKEELPSPYNYVLKVQ